MAVLGLVWLAVIVLIVVLAVLVLVWLAVVLLVVLAVLGLV